MSSNFLNKLFKKNKEQILSDGVMEENFEMEEKQVSVRKRNKSKGKREAKESKKYQQSLNNEDIIPDTNSSDDNDMADKPENTASNEEVVSETEIAVDKERQQKSESEFKKVDADQSEKLVQLIQAIEEKVIDEIKNNQTIIDEDIANTGDYIISTVKARLDKIGEKIEEKNKDTMYFKETLMREIIGISSKKNHKEADDVISFADNAARKITDTQDLIMSKIKSVNKKVDQINELCEATEMIEGKLEKLDQLDGIASVLSEKGVEITREFPPTCVEEEDILNLVKYSKKITEQLGYAARDLIRKKAVYESKDQNIVNEQKVTEKKIEDAKEQGIVEGKKSVIKALLGKYTDVDTIIESKVGHVSAIWSLLTELGVSYDGDGSYKKGKIIDLSTEDVEKMSAVYKKFDGDGKYRVVKSGLVYEDEVVFKAEFEKVIAGPENVEREQEQDEKAEPDSKTGEGEVDSKAGQVND